MRAALRFPSLILPALIATGIHSWAQTIDDGFLPKVAGTVRCVTATPNGKLWIGGEITQVNSTQFQNLACLQWDGIVSKTPVFDTDGTVLCLLPMADNSLWVGGAFSEVSKHSRAGLARLRESDGTTLLDFEFAPEFDGEVRCLLADGDGVLVGGNFLRVNGLRRAGVVRLLQNGEVDPAFDAKLEGESGITVNAMARQPDGKILLGGLFDMAGNQAVANLARLYPSGALDSRFLGSADGEVHAIGVQATSNIVIGGDFLNASGNPAARLARLNRHGAFAQTLDGFDDRVSTIGIQPDGRILVGGRFGPVAATTEGKFVRLTADLQIEKSDARVGGEVFCCLPQSDGRLLVGGSFTRAGTGASYNLARLDSGLRADATVGSRNGPTNGAVTTAVQLPDEKLLFTGTFSSFGGFSYNGFTRTDSNVSRDTTFSNFGIGIGATGIQVRRDQKVLLFGDMTTGPRPGIVRLQSTGAFDQSFNPSFSASTSPVMVNAIADQGDEQLLLGGNFTHINQAARSLIGLVSGSGGLSQNSFPQIALEAPPTDLLGTIAGELFIGGMIPQIGEIPARPYFHRYSQGKLMSSYQGIHGAKLNGMCRLPDGNTLVWGILPLGKEGNLVRLGKEGKVDSSFAPYFSGEVRSVSVQADGSMFVVGSFYSYRLGSSSWSTADGFVHLGPDLRPKSTTSPTSMGPAGVARAGLVQADGKFLFWGGFRSTKGSSRSGLARLSTVVPASQELGIDSDERSSPTIVWQRSGSAPQVERVWFSTSTNGITYGAATEGRWVNGRWMLDKFASTPGHPLWIRAEGRVPSTGGGDAGGLVQSIRQVFLESEVDVALDEKSLIDGSEEVVDFGASVQGSLPVIRSFTITNRGNSRLTLGEPVVPEGFVVSTLLPQQLLPGDHTTIEVVSDLSKVGDWTGELVIPSNDIDEPEFMVSLRSRILTPLRTTLLKPQAKLNRKTGLREQSIRVRNAAGITFPGYRVIIHGLPPGVVVSNATEQLPDGGYVIEVMQPLGPFSNVEVKVEYSFPPKTPAKLIPRITTEVILAPAGE